MKRLSELVSPKVIAAASGAGAGVIVSGFLVWLIGAIGYGVGFAAADADAAVAAVPLQVTGMIGLVLTVVGAFVPGYQTTDPARDVDATMTAGGSTKTVGGSAPDAVSGRAHY